MNDRLCKTLNKYDKQLVGYEFIDAYNMSIRSDGIAGTLTTRVDQSNMIFVVDKVRNNEKNDRNI